MALLQCKVDSKKKKIISPGEQRDPTAGDKEAEA